MPHLSFSADGWCSGAARYDSPYCDARPEGALIDLLVIHNISLPAGSFGGGHVSDLLTGRIDYNADPSFADLRGLEVSAHFFIRRDSRIIQYVSANQRAWHAGVSCFRERPDCNGYSIGIEMEGYDFVAFAPVQYTALAALTAALLLGYPLDQVCGHEHIAAGRRTDPGPFCDWSFYKETLLKTQKKQPRLALTYRALGFSSTL